MGRALEFTSDNPTLEQHPKLSLRRGAFSYSIERGSDATATYTVTDGKESVTVPLRWAFGAGSQTYVLERDGHFFESMVSYYPKIGGLDVTLGDQVLQPRTVPEAIGRELSTQQVKECFGCHTTGGVVDGKLNLQSLRPGVSCEHCHHGAPQHFAAITHGKLESVPPKLKNFSAEDVANFCGQCHRSWETVARNRQWRGEINVRFQPYRLANSKCFDGSDARISCIACHDPHQEIVRDQRAYDAKCLACHSAQAKPSLGMIAAHAGEKDVQMKVCPVSKERCVSCHMPKIDLPGGHQTFTDHQIRIVRANDRYPD